LRESPAGGQTPRCRDDCSGAAVVSLVVGPLRFRDDLMCSVSGTFTGQFCGRVLWVIVGHRDAALLNGNDLSVALTRLGTGLG
jgi:hypothetical protein